MNLEFLRTIVAIADQGSLLAAGQALGLSHSAVSLRIKSLEEDLGVQLLDRSARPIRLTPDGEEMLLHARELERIRQEVRLAVRSGELRGNLRVGAVPTTLTHLVPPALALLRRNHPEIELHVRSGLSGELALALRQGEIDTALLSEPALPMEDLATKLILEEELVLIAATGVEGLSWRQAIKDHPFIWFSRKTWAGQLIERYLLHKRLSVHGQMEVDSLEAISAMVRHGLGVAIVPMRAGGGHDQGGLRQLRLDDPVPRRRLVIMQRPGSSRSKLTAALVEALGKATADNESEK